MNDTTSGEQDLTRVILFHKQSTSARTRFLLFDDNTVCGFSPLPALAQYLEEDEAESPAALPHPAASVRAAERRLGLADGGLEAVGEYRGVVDAPGGAIHVFLAGFTAIDPPFEAMEAQGARFIDLTQARGLPPAELGLLRKAYETILGG